MSKIKSFLNDFPTTNGRVVATICLIVVTGLVVCVRLIRGADFPGGYDTWIWALVVLAGVDSAQVVGKRLSDFRYKAAGTSPVTVEAPSNVTVTTEAAAPAAEPVEDTAEDGAVG